MKTSIEQELSLFAIYLGGRADGCNIELHDVVFVVSTSIEACHPKLPDLWFGNRNRLHIDSYIDLKEADGFRIELSSKESEAGLKLFFLNFGGYEKDLFGEHHQNAFFVAKDRPGALKRARQELCVGMIEQHLDDSLDVEGELDIDDIIEISEVDGYHLHFIPIESSKRSVAIPGYTKLTVKLPADG